MNLSKIITNMCGIELTGADIKAISKARDFKAREMQNRAVLEHSLLSDQGLNSAFGLLSQKENILLHFMAQHPQARDVTFFKTIYSNKSKTASWGRTFNQRYKDVFTETKHCLIRRGILFFAEDFSQWEKSTKLEKLVFYFPKEFQKYLPSPFKNSMKMPEKGDCNDAFIINKLHEITGKKNKSLGANAKAKNFRLAIIDGRLSVGDAPFSVEQIKKWQKSCWLDAMGTCVTPESWSEAIVDAVEYALSTLKTGEWILARELQVPVKTFCKLHSLSWDKKSNPEFDIEKICAFGWESRCLEKKQNGKNTFYRLAEPYSSDCPATGFEQFLQPDTKMTLIVNPDLIPLKILEKLASVSDFKMQGASLTAKPNFIAFEKVFQNLCDDPMVVWLRENVHAYKKLIQEIESKWGNQVIHKNLLVAKINDLSLKMAIKKQFSDPSKLVLLPKDFIAFPKSYLKEIQTLVKKTGFVVKSIHAQEN